MIKKTVWQTALGGILCAQAIAVNFLESLIPALPFLPPGAKPGFSNIVTMFAAGNLGLPQALVIAVVKSGFVFVTRGFTAGAMSLSGGVLSALAAYILLEFCKEKTGLVGISVVCALLHNAAQLCVSVIMTGSKETFGYAPFLAISGLVTGILTGLIFRAVLPALEKQKKYFMKV